MSNQKNIAVLGAGSWGTTLANHLCNGGCEVSLWSPFEQELQEIQQDRCNSRYLPGINLSENIRTEADLAHAVENSGAILVAVPGRFFQEIVDRPPVRALAEDGLSIINASKGLSRNSSDPNDLSFASEAFAQILGHQDNYINLSGPTFARELAEQNYSAVLVSGSDPQKVEEVRKMFNSSFLQTYPGDDLIGAEIGGVLKNGYAVLAGACAGLGYAANTYSAVLTACLAEMRSFGISQGARSETFLGLSGVGDLILTAGSKLSRNYRLGFQVARGQSVAEAQREIGQETEGYHTALAARWLAGRQGSDLKILDGVRKMLNGKLQAEAVVAELFATK